jgi:hypothetical protein
MSLIHDYLQQQSVVLNFPSAIAGLVGGGLVMWVFIQVRNRSVLVDPSTHRVLNGIARKTGKRPEDLLREALRDLFSKYRIQEDA